MNERVKELAKPYLMHERFSRYGESTEEEYYDFLPEELDEFVKLIVAWSREECAKMFDDKEDQPFYGRHVADYIRKKD